MIHTDSERCSNCWSENSFYDEAVKRLLAFDLVITATQGILLQMLALFPHAIVSVAQVSQMLQVGQS